MAAYLDSQVIVLFWVHVPPSALLYRASPILQSVFDSVSSSSLSVNPMNIGSFPRWSMYNQYVVLGCSVKLSVVVNVSSSTELVMAEDVVRV